MDSTDLFTCGICYEAYDEYERKPKMLECHHTYCCLCLESLYERNDRKRVICPICSVASKPGKSGITGLSTNHYLNKFSDVLKIQHQVDSALNKELLNHPRMMNQHFQNPPCCTKHGESMDLKWCQSCKTIVCPKCLYGDHTASGGHKILSITASIGDIGRNITTMLSELKTNMNTLTTVQDELRIVMKSNRDRGSWAISQAMEAPYTAMCTRIHELDVCVDGQILELNQMDVIESDIGQLNKMQEKLNALMTIVQDYQPSILNLKEEAMVMAGADILVTFLPASASARTDAKGESLSCPQCKKPLRSAGEGRPLMCGNCRALSYKMITE